MERVVASPINGASRRPLTKTWSVPDLGVEQALGRDRDAAVLERAPDAIRFAGGSLEPAREVEQLLRFERVALRIADHHHARLQAFLHVLPDDDADLAAIQLHRAAEREDADAADELLDEHRIEESAAPLVQHAERGRRRYRLGIGPARGERIEGVDDAGDRAEQSDILAFQAFRVAAAVLALVVE